MMTMVKSMLMLLVLGAVAPVFASDQAYYEQFLFAEERDDDGDGEVLVQYRYLMGSLEVPVDALNKILVDTGLMLFADGKFRLEYQESQWRRASEAEEWAFVPDFSCPPVIEGQWSVPDQALLVGDLGTGARTLWHDQHAVALTFTRAPGNPALAGKTLTLSYGYSNVGLERPRSPWCSL